MRGKRPSKDKDAGRPSRQSRYCTYQQTGGTLELGTWRSRWVNYREQHRYCASATQAGVKLSLEGKQEHDLPKKGN